MDTPTSTTYPPSPTPTPAPSTSPASPAPASATPRPRSNKGIIVALVIVLLLLGGYFAWAWTADSWPFAPAQPMATASPSPSTTVDPTAGWQTYTNTQYGFEVEFPPSWLVASDSGQTSFTSPETKMIADENAVACNDDSAKTPCNPEIVAVDVVFSPRSDEVASGSTKEVMFNEISFTEYEAVSLYGEKHYKTMKDGATLDFTAYDRPILNQILSTFRFTR